MTTKRPLKLTLATTILALVAVVTVRCKDSDTITGAHSFLPTPMPPADLAGTWTGTYSTGSRGFTDCVGIAITAAFVQTGTHASATIEARRSNCGVPTSLDGVLSGNAWRGRAIGFFSLDAVTAQANGGLSDGTLTFSLTGRTYASRIELHR